MNVAAKQAQKWPDDFESHCGTSMICAPFEAFPDMIEQPLAVLVGSLQCLVHKSVQLSPGQLPVKIEDLCILALAISFLQAVRLKSLIL